MLTETNDKPIDFALELKIGRKVMSGDEDKVRTMLAEMEAVTAAQQMLIAKKSGMWSHG